MDKREKILELENQISALNKERRFEEKMKLVKKGIELDPKNIIFNSNLGLYYYGKGDYEKAYKYLRICVAQGDRLVPIKKRYFHCLIATNKTPDELDRQLILGQFERNSDFLDNHIIVLKKLLQSRPLNKELLFTYVTFLREHTAKNIATNVIVSEFDEYVNMLDNDEMSFKILHQMISVLFSRNVHKVEKYIEILKDKIDAQTVGKIKLGYSKRFYSKCLSRLEKMKSDSENNAENFEEENVCVNSNLNEIVDLEKTIISLNQEKRYSEKLPYIQRGLELAPDNKFFNYNMGMYCFDKGNLGDAYNYFKKCIKLKEESRDLEVKFVKCMIELGITPDITEKRMLKKYFDAHKKFTQNHLILLERCLKEENLDLDIVYFYLTYKYRTRDIDNLDQNFDFYLSKLDGCSISFSVIQIMINILLQINVQKAEEYIKIYRKMMDESQAPNQDRREEKYQNFIKRLDRIKNQ